MDEIPFKNTKVSLAPSCIGGKTDLENRGIVILKTMRSLGPVKTRHARRPERPAQSVFVPLSLSQRC
jgi:hypothetical protein